jgi:dienelactone hydrolase
VIELVAHTYDVDEVRLTGFLADGASRGPAPGILLAHEAPGVTAHVKERARMLAECGYVAFALDMYGRTDLPLEEARERSRQLMSDAALMRRRARAALDLLASQAHCDASRLAVVGFCLGGIVALELARDRAPIRCAVGFHPGLMRPAGSTSGPIAAKVLIMVGEDDPVVPAEARASFIREMDEGRADWQLHVFGGVGHSYTNRQIEARGFAGFAYNERADRRAWKLMLSLFEEVF